MTPLEQIEYKGYTINVHHDRDPMHPRKDWDNLGTMVCWHNRYNLGDKHNYQDAQDFFDDMKDKAYVFPIYMYEHGNVAFSMSDFNDQWDSGQVGFMYITYDKAKQEYPDMTDCERAIACFKMFKSELQTYSAYINGEVYGQVITDSKGDEVDSCWGFYDMDDMVTECKSTIDYLVEQERKAKQEHIKKLIKNKVGLCYRK